MTKIQNEVFKQDLNKYRVYIEDTSPTSKYFKISQLPDVFSGGKNAFLIEGTPFLNPTTTVLVEIVDAAGNAVYTEPIRNYVEGTSRLVVVEVYGDTAPGPATITILGELRTDEFGNPTPIEWVGKYNVKWTSNVTISPSTINTTKIRLQTTPTVSIVETLAPYLEPITSLQQNISAVGSVTGFTNQRYASTDSYIHSVYTIKSSQAVFSASMETGRFQATINGIPYSASITRVINTTTMEVSPPYTSSNSIVDFSTDAYSITHFPAPQYQYSFMTRSFANVSLSGLDTLSGDIARVKVFIKNDDLSEQYTLIDDVRIEPTELLQTSSVLNNTNKVLMGSFDTQQVVSDYWTVGNIIAETYANLVGDVTASRSSNNLMNGVEVLSPLSGNFYLGQHTSYIPNQCISSSNLQSPGWAVSQTTTTVNHSQAPNGRNTSTKLIDTVASANHQISSSVFTFPTGSILRVSAFVSASELSNCLIWVSNVAQSQRFGISASVSPLSITDFTISTGVPDPSQVLSSNAYLVGNSWYYVEAVGTLPSTVNTASVFIRLRNSSGVSTYTGDGVSGMHFWGVGVTYTPTTQSLGSQIFTKGVEYSLTYNAFCSASTESTIEVWASGTAFPNTLDMGVLVDTITITPQGTKALLLDQTASIVPTVSGTGDIYFVVRSGRWTVSNVSVKTAAETGFNPPSVNFLSPITNRRLERLKFKLELYDNNNNIVPVSIETDPIFFDGGNAVIKGTDNRVAGKIIIAPSGSGVVIGVDESGSYVGISNLDSNSPNPPMPRPINPIDFSTYVGPSIVTMYSGSTPFSGSRPATSSIGFQVIQSSASYFDFNSHTGLSFAGESIVMQTPSFYLNTDKFVSGNNVLKIGPAGQSITVANNAGLYVDGAGNFRVGTDSSGSDYIQLLTGVSMKITSSNFQLQGGTTLVINGQQISLGSPYPTSSVPGNYVGFYTNNSGTFYVGTGSIAYISFDSSSLVIKSNATTVNNATIGSLSISGSLRFLSGSSIIGFEPNTLTVNSLLLRTINSPNTESIDASGAKISILGWQSASVGTSTSQSLVVGTYTIPLNATNTATSSKGWSSAETINKSTAGTFYSVSPPSISLAGNNDAANDQYILFVSAAYGSNPWTLAQPEDVLTGQYTTYLQYNLNGAGWNNGIAVPGWSFTDTAGGSVQYTGSYVVSVANGSTAVTSLQFRLFTTLNISTDTAVIFGGDTTATLTGQTVSWSYQSAGTSLYRRNVKVFAQTSGGVKLPHIYFEPHNSFAPENPAIGSAGEVTFLSRSLIVHNGTSFRNVAFHDRSVVGNAGAAITVDWSSASIQRITLNNAGAAAISFSNPFSGSIYTLEVLQDNAGNRTVTWPGTVIWPAAATPTLTTTGNRKDVFRFYYDGINYLGHTIGLNYNTTT